MSLNAACHLCELYTVRARLKLCELSFTIQLLFTLDAFVQANFVLRGKCWSKPQLQKAIWMDTLSLLCQMPPRH